ncbi:PGF-CTERM sorting domain-containing protein [Methanolobus sp. WCC4]|uniref:PGF-CTERM sorting domain-containing protein n=1 Tax=Methanolobus sp. WCC4 TaxID=3125784 RepID=UPI0030FA7DC3
MKHRLVSISLMLVVVTLAGITVTSATTDAQGVFNQTYSVEGTALDSCGICHGEAALTPYGMDALASGLDLASIEDDDSDEDGFTNIEEINALTSPGDPDDYPETMMEEEEAEAEDMEEEPVSEETSESQAPGFEIVFAIAGIVSVAYLKRKR